MGKGGIARPPQQLARFLMDKTIKNEDIGDMALEALVIFNKLIQGYGLDLHDDNIS